MLTPVMLCMWTGYAGPQASSLPAVRVIPLAHELQELDFIHEGCQWQGPVEEEDAERKGWQCLDLPKQPHGDKRKNSLRSKDCYPAPTKASQTTGMCKLSLALLHLQGRAYAFAGSRQARLHFPCCVWYSQQITLFSTTHDGS